jgi:hypothetical protein
MSNKNSSFYLKPKQVKQQNEEWHLSLGMHNFRAAERSCAGDSKSPIRKSVSKHSSGGGARVKRVSCETNLVRAAQLPFFKELDKSRLGYRAEWRRLRAKKLVDGSPVKSPVKARSEIKKRVTDRKVKRREWIIAHGVKYLKRSKVDRGTNVVKQFHAANCSKSPGKEVTMENTCKYFIAKQGRRELTQDEAFEVPSRILYRCEFRISRYRIPSQPRNLKKDLCFLYRKLRSFRKWKQRSTRKERRRCLNTTGRRLTRVRHTKPVKVCKTPTSLPRREWNLTSGSSLFPRVPQPKLPVPLMRKPPVSTMCSTCAYISSKVPGDAAYHVSMKCIMHR